MKIAEANKELLKGALFAAANAWLDSKPKNAVQPQAPSDEVGGPDLNTPQVKVLKKAVKDYSTHKLLDLSVNPEDRRLVDIWLDNHDHTILQVDTVSGKVEEY